MTDIKEVPPQIPINLYGSSGVADKPVAPDKMDAARKPHPDSWAAMYPAGGGGDKPPPDAGF